MVKRCIYQVYLGPKNKLYDFCTNSVARYCEKYGIEHVIQREPILRIQPDVLRSGRSKMAVERMGYLPIYEKENAFDLLGEYDQISIIDADIYVREDAPNVFEAMNHDKYAFGAVVERTMPITLPYMRKITAYSHGQYNPVKSHTDFKWNHMGAEFMNMGMIVINTKLKPFINGTAKEFITQDRFRDFVDGIGMWKWSTDQTLLNYWIRKDGVPYECMEWKWNGLYRGIKDEHLPDTYFIHFFLKDHLPEKGENMDKFIKEQNLL